ncbi:MAG: hypothetical protein ACK5OC_07860, partial [Pirellula sp.]
PQPLSPKRGEGSKVKKMWVKIRVRDHRSATAARAAQDLSLFKSYISKRQAFSSQEVWSIRMNVEWTANAIRQLSGIWRCDDP